MSKGSPARQGVGPLDVVDRTRVLLAHQNIIILVLDVELLGGDDPKCTYAAA